MKILIEVSGLSQKTFHYFASHLKKINPDFLFGFIVKSEFRDFLNFDKKYNNKIFLYPKNFSSAITEIESIIDFEEKAKTSMWEIISKDRNIGGTYQSNSVGYGSSIQSDKNSLINIFSNKLAFYKQIFSDFQPDIFIPAMAQASIDVSILEGLCKIHSCEYVVLASARVKNYFSFCNNAMLNITGIDKTYYQENNTNVSTQSRELYTELINELEAPDYFDSIVGVSPRVSLSESNKLVLVRPFVLFFEAIKYGFKNQNFFYAKTAYQIGLKRGIQSIRLKSKSFGIQPKSGDKFIYFPLHLNPEYSTLYQGGMITDQLVLIEMLSKSIPSNWTVLVKEHPATIKFRLRPKKFYKKISSFPNVFFIRTFEDTHKIISRSSMIATISGTSAWEAILRGKPVLTFSPYKDVFNATDLSSEVKDMNSLPETIRNELERISNITPEERQKRITKLLDSILINSFWVTHPKVMVYDEIGSEEQYETCGKELAEGFINYLQKLKINYKKNI